MITAKTPVLALDDFKQIAQGVDHPEGICMIDDTLYVSGEKGQLYRIDDQSPLGVRKPQATSGAGH